MAACRTAWRTNLPPAYASNKCAYFLRRDRFTLTLSSLTWSESVFMISLFREWSLAIMAWVTVRNPCSYSLSSKSE